MEHRRSSPKEEEVVQLWRMMSEKWSLHWGELEAERQGLPVRHLRTSSANFWKDGRYVLE